MSELLAAQKAGNETGDKSRLHMDAGKIDKQYSQYTFPGHSAWLDWPWKFHRIEEKEGLDLELYNLVDDPQGQNNMVDKYLGQAKVMKAELEQWQRSVVRSLNGEDYQVLTKLKRPPEAVKGWLQALPSP